MQAILRKLLKSVEWQLLSSSGDNVPLPLRATSAANEHQRLVECIAASRTEVFEAEGFTTDHHGGWTDLQAWHIVAIDRQSGSVAGALRLFVIDRIAFPLQPKNVLELGGVGFDCSETERVHLQAVEALLSRYASERHFIYVGGLFVAADWRRSGLAAALALAANCLVRFFRCPIAAAFATTRNKAADLLLRLGGHRLEVEGTVVPPFYCTTHQEQGQLLGWHPYSIDPRFEATISTLASLFQARPVITRGPGRS